jgi:hypothetical protein
VIYDLQIYQRLSIHWLINFHTVEISSVGTKTSIVTIGRVLKMGVVFDLLIWTVNNAGAFAAGKA